MVSKMADFLRLSHPLVRVGDMSVCIDCADCVRQNTSDCDDCIVTFITASDGPAAERSVSTEAVVIDLEDYAALKRLQAAGMVPDLRHQTG